MHSASNAAQSAGDPRALASPPQVATYLGIPVATLYQWRHRGIGPQGTTVGRHIRYRWQEVERWLDSQTDQDAA